MREFDYKYVRKCSFVKTENIVCSGSFNQPVNLSLLAQERVIEYDPEMYHGGYIKTKNHSITIYRSGKYIMPGIKSSEDAAETFAKMKEILAPYLDTALFDEPSIRNMVCSAYARHELILSRLYLDLIGEDYDAVYEPEAFPGLILKMDNCTYNVFSSGKYLILGCTDVAQAEAAELNFINLVQSVYQ